MPADSQFQTPSVLVIQDAARHHYAIPRMLHEHGMLHRMVTDFFHAPGSATAALAGAIGGVAPGLAAQLRSRSCEGIPGSRVVDFPVRGGLGRLLRQLAPRRFATLSHLAPMQARIARRHMDGANLVYAFIPCTDPRLIGWARRRGLAVVGDQVMAPWRFMQQIMREHGQRFPDWQRPDHDEDDPRWVEFVDRVEQEMWDGCDRIIGGSDFVKDQLLARGVPARKLAVVESPLDAAQFPFVDRSDRSDTQPVTVGFVGQVGLRKGAPYLLEAAMRLPADRYRFELVGPIAASEAAVGPYRERVTLRGPVPRERVHEALAGFDMLVLPSLCEGSATAVNEAMATGLPVICTPNTGSRVIDGEHGHTVGVGDVEALVERIDSLGRDKEKRLHLGRQAHQHVASYDSLAYGKNLARVLRALVSEKQPTTGAATR